MMDGQPPEIRTMDVRGDHQDPPDSTSERYSGGDGPTAEDEHLQLLRAGLRSCAELLGVVVERPHAFADLPALADMVVTFSIELEEYWSGWDRSRFDYRRSLAPLAQLAATAVHSHPWLALEALVTVVEIGLEAASRWPVGQLSYSDRLQIHLRLQELARARTEAPERSPSRTANPVGEFTTASTNPVEKDNTSTATSGAASQGEPASGAVKEPKSPASSPPASKYQQAEAETSSIDAAAPRPANTPCTRSTPRTDVGRRRRRRWSKIPSGRCKGLTAPQAVFRDPDWYYWAMEGDFFEDADMSDEAMEVAVKARSIKIPGDGDLVAEYVVHPVLRKFCDLRLIPRDRPPDDRPGRSFRREVIDLSIPRRIHQYDKKGNRLLVQALKHHLLGDASHAMTRKRAEAFFEDDGNFDL